MKSMPGDGAADADDDAREPEKPPSAVKLPWYATMFGWLRHARKE